MSTHYIDNASSGSQYYFTTNNSPTSQTYRTYTTPGTSTINSSGYTTYPVNVSSSRSSNQQQIRYDDLHQTSQQYQSVAGFNKNVTQQQYQSTPQVRATARAITSQDQYHIQRSQQQREQIQASPQHFQVQFDSSRQPGSSTGPAVVYQTPGAAQYTHHNVDLWTETPSHGQDYYVQAQRVSVRPVSTGSPQQSQSVSPQRPQDHLQEYYSQLTPEQHQQLLRQQQIQKQQEQNSYYEQKHQVTSQQVSPPVAHHQETHRSTAGFHGGQHVSPQQPQFRGRTESERQHQDEHDYYAAQRQMAAQRHQQEQSSHPVGIRSLMNRFNASTPPVLPTPQFQPRSKSSSTRHYSSSNYSSSTGSRQTTTTTTTTRSQGARSMTYSALPKAREPPVNSLEYFQMQQQQDGNPFTTIQQAAAPLHIQHAPAGFGAIRDRFKTGSLSDDFSRTQIIDRQPPPQHYQQQQQQQQQTASAAGNTLSSLRNQYMNLAKESTHHEPHTEQVHHISRTIIGEDTPEEKQRKQKQQQQQQAAAQASKQKQETTTVTQQQPQTEIADQQESSSVDASKPPDDAAATL